MQQCDKGKKCRMVGETRKASATDFGEDKLDLLLKLAVALDRSHNARCPSWCSPAHSARLRRTQAPAAAMGGNVKGLVVVSNVKCGKPSKG